MHIDRIFYIAQVAVHLARESWGSYAKHVGHGAGYTLGSLW